MKFLCFLLILLTYEYSIAASESITLKKVELDSKDALSLQRGANTFFNYCSGCHGASYMRYNFLNKIGVSNEVIKKNLITVEQKVGDLIESSMNVEDAKKWFGVAPPDLSVISRSRGKDWLYSYFTSFYLDEDSPTGWNNLTYPNVAMPHVLWDLQGTQIKEVRNLKVANLVLQNDGVLSKKEYENFIKDLVNFLVYVGEPHQNTRKKFGILVFYFLGIIFVFAYLLKKEYWKDVN